MTWEHTAAADSTDQFCTSNYAVTTTPKIEWWFVVEPERGTEWPVEGALREAPDKRRKPLPLRELDARRRKENGRLRRLGEPELLQVEVFGARLYTGPM